MATKKRTPPIQVMADTRMMLIHAVDAGDFDLAQRALDVMRRIYRRDDAAVAEGREMTTGEKE